LLRALDRGFDAFVSFPANADGTWLDAPPLVDLGEVDEGGEYRRSIVKVTDPDRYGLTVSDYFS